MYPAYQNSTETFEIYQRKGTHISPHVHTSLECVYVVEGSLELGIGTELYHMAQGDFALVVPGLIHHYQCFCEGKSRITFFLAALPFSGSFQSTLQTSCPVNPVIPARAVHPDIVYALRTILASSRVHRKNPIPYADVMRQAYLQIILSRALPHLKLTERPGAESDDLMYRTVSYVAEHYTEEITLTGMASDLHVSPYALSRLFSSVFHMNFNQYVNDMRLEYARYLLENTDQTITEAYENAGFASQRTFNRVFRDEYHMSPREYRAAYRAASEQ
ncbi:MAG: helix-turn-helix domain-containing protein [Lachnospiraceae bacterium]|nr:helix-turn-helix domain-containing protein [Lachnospiraceae bacterium]